MITNIFKQFNRLNTTINWWMRHHSITILRFSLGLIFGGFGLLKFFPTLIPITIYDLVTRSTTTLTFHLLSGQSAMNFIGSLETIIGICFLTKRFLRLASWIMAFQMIGAFSPLVFFPAELFPGPTHAPTLAAMYIFKDIVFVAAGMVMAATWTGAQEVS